MEKIRDTTMPLRIMQLWIYEPEIIPRYTLRYTRNSLGASTCWRNVLPETMQEMTSIPTPLGDTQEFYAQVHRILNSTSFRDAPSSRRLLEYIATCSLQGREEQLKEFSIGIDVLGRRPDFDPKTDTIVRVQVRRLRQKISQYYETEGSHDRVFITIPRGRYMAAFSVVPPEPVGNSQDAVEDTESVPPISVSDVPNVGASAGSPNPPATSSVQAPLPSGWRVRTWLPLLVLAVLCGALGEYWIARLLHKETSSDPVRKLWSAMLEGDSSPIIGYPDAVYLLDGTSNMFQFSDGPIGARGTVVDPGIALRFASSPELVARAGPLYYENGGYTGTGEIESVAALTALLHDLGFHPRMKRSRDIRADDLKTHHVILLGGSAQNTAVENFKIPGDFEYDYKRGDWSGTIINHRPSSKEETIYSVERDSSTHILKSDYALVSCLPGIDSTHRIIVLGGLDTTGTFGATSYITSKDGSEVLSRAFENNYQQPYFQAVIHVVLRNGYEVFSTQAVAVHGKSTDSQIGHP